MQLRIPGPTPCPDNVLQAVSGQMVNHRGKQFGELMEHVTYRLKEVFQTEGDVYVLSTSGTGGMEALVVNSLSPGDRVLAVSTGAFGERFGNIAEIYGASVNRLNFEWGQAADPDAVRQALKEDQVVKAVLLTHNETSTGVTNDLQSLAAVAKEFDKLVLVDAISSLGSIDLPVDAWGCDMVATGSQKGWMTPPGLAMVSINQKGWDAYSRAKMPRFYFDLGQAQKFLEKKQTPWTPTISIFYGLAVGLDMMAEEGLSNVVIRHCRVGQRARDHVKSMGLSLFPSDETYASNTVTAVNAPDGVDVKKMLQVLRDEKSVVLAGGQRDLDGKIFRIGHLGLVEESDMDKVASALSTVLSELGYRK